MNHPLSNRRLRGDIFALLLVATLAFGLRLFRLADASIWWDEGWSVWLARQGLVDIARVTAADVHPPLYYWLLHFWIGLAGQSEFGVRFLSVCLGTLTVFAVWFWGRLLVPDRPWVAVAGAALAAVSRFSIWWSQETRMYVLGALLATLSLAFTVRLRQTRTWRMALACMLATLAALWNLYLLAFLLPIQSLYWLWTLRSERPWRRWAELAALWTSVAMGVLAAWAPWLAYALPRMRAGSVQAAFGMRAYLQLYATLLTLGLSTHVERYWLPVLAVFGIVVLGWVISAVRPRRGGMEYLSAKKPDISSGSLLLLFLTLLVPPAAVWLVTMIPRSLGYLPKPEARYLLPFAPAFSLLVTWAAGELAGRAGRASRWASFVLWLLPILLSSWSLRQYYATRYWRDDYRSVALVLQAFRRPDDAVVLHNDQGWPVFAYHWSGSFSSVAHSWSMDERTADGFLSPLWQAHPALWLVANEDALAMDPQRQLEKWLEQRATARHEWRFGSKRVLLFARTPARAEGLLELSPDVVPMPPPRPLAEGGLSLVGWEQPWRRVSAGETLWLSAYVDRQNAGGRLEVQLGKPALATASVDVPEGSGLLRLSLSVQVSTDAAAQTAQWYVRLGNQEAAEGTMQVVAAPQAPQVLRQPQYPLVVDFGEQALVRLLGYDLNGVVVAPGGTVTVVLYWQALSTPSVSYKVFTHVVSAQGRVAAQRDDYPVQGSHPTTLWMPGEVVADEYLIAIPPDMELGSYSLYVGFYDPATGDRLQAVRNAAGVPQPDHQATLRAITVVRP